MMPCCHVFCAPRGRRSTRETRIKIPKLAEGVNAGVRAKGPTKASSKKKYSKICEWDDNQCRKIVSSLSNFVIRVAVSHEGARSEFPNPKPLTFNCLGPVIESSLNLLFIGQEMGNDSLR